jgi:hypothetical protein
MALVREARLRRADACSMLPRRGIENWPGGFIPAPPVFVGEGRRRQADVHFDIRVEGALLWDRHARMFAAGIQRFFLWFLVDPRQKHMGGGSCRYQIPRRRDHHGASFPKPAAGGLIAFHPPAQGHCKSARWIHPRAAMAIFPCGENVRGDSSPRLKVEYGRYTFDLRQPAATASASVQNQRSPFSGSSTVWS